MSESLAYPVQVLREHITGLEAAISVCLADPDHKPVHKLRTETRRVEALLLLLGLIPDLPDHRKEAAALLRTLTKLRRAAGSVRDLDVHRKMLETFAEQEQMVADTTPQAEANAAPAEVKPAKRSKSKTRDDASSAESKDGAPQDPAKEAALLSQSAAELRKRMGRERDKAATALQAMLKDRQGKTARAAEALLKVLEPAQEFALPGTDLLRDANAVLTREGLLAKRDIRKLDEDELHTVRKAAKKARYLAESLPEDAALVAAAERFEALQEAGGQWHDALELAQAARRYFGKGHELTATYRTERDRKLDAYRTALATASPEPPRKQKAERKGGKPEAAKGKPASAVVPKPSAGKPKPVRAPKSASAKKATAAAA